jgi:hypothetical protein
MEAVPNVTGRGKETPMERQNQSIVVPEDLVASGIAVAILVEVIALTLMLTL